MRVLKYVSAKAAHRFFCSGNAHGSGALSFVIANNLLLTAMAYASLLNPPPLTERLALEAALSLLIVCVGSVYVYQSGGRSVRGNFLGFFFVMNVPLTLHMFLAVTGSLYAVAYILLRVFPQSVHVYPGLETAIIVAGVGYIFLRMANFARTGGEDEKDGAS